MPTPLSLEDEREVSRLLVRYCTAIDTRDWVLFRTCFTDDFIGDYGVLGKWDSGSAITRGMEEMHAKFGPTLHRLSNIVVTAGSDGVTTRSYVDAIVAEDLLHKPLRQAIGFYDDHIINANGWKIKHRKFNPVCRFM
jgi:hypothetical protein